MLTAAKEAAGGRNQVNPCRSRRGELAGLNAAAGLPLERLEGTCASGKVALVQILLDHAELECWSASAQHAARSGARCAQVAPQYYTHFDYSLQLILLFWVLGPVQSTPYKLPYKLLLSVVVIDQITFRLTYTEF